MPGHASLRNAYRSRKTDAANNMRVPQSFAFFPREGRNVKYELRVDFWISKGIHEMRLINVSIWCQTYSMITVDIGPTFILPCQPCLTVEMALRRTRASLDACEAKVTRKMCSLWWRPTWPTYVWYNHPSWCGHTLFWALLSNSGIRSMWLMKLLHNSSKNPEQMNCWNLLSKSNRISLTWTGVSGTTEAWLMHVSPENHTKGWCLSMQVRMHHLGWVMWGLAKGHKLPDHINWKLFSTMLLKGEIILEWCNMEQWWHKAMGCMANSLFCGFGTLSCGDRGKVAVLCFSAVGV